MIVSHLQHAGNLLRIELLHHSINVVHLLHVAVVGRKVCGKAVGAGIGGVGGPAGLVRKVVLREMLT